MSRTVALISKAIGGTRLGRQDLLKLGGALLYLWSENGATQDRIRAVEVQQVEIVETQRQINAQLSLVVTSLGLPDSPRKFATLRPVEPNAYEAGIGPAIRKQLRQRTGFDPARSRDSAPEPVRFMGASVRP